MVEDYYVCLYNVLLTRLSDVKSVSAFVHDVKSDGQHFIYIAPFR